jgi:hypothetical protein
MNEEIVEAVEIADTIEHQETKLDWFAIDVSDGYGDRSVAVECAFSMIQLELDFGDAE